MQSGRAISPSVPWSSQMSGQAGLCHFFSKLLGRFGGNRSATGGRTVSIPVPACRSRRDLRRYVAVSGLHGPPRTPGGENPPGRDETSRSTRSKNGRKTAIAQPREHSQTSGNDQRVGLGGPEVAKNTTDAGRPPDGAGTAGTAVRSPEFCKKPGFSQLQTRISQPRIRVQTSGLAHRNRGKFVRPVSIRPTPDGEPEAPENATFLQKHARFHLFSGCATSPPAPTAGYVPDRTVRCPGRVPGSSGKAHQGTARPSPLELRCICHAQLPLSGYLRLTPANSGCSLVRFDNCIVSAVPKNIDSQSFSNADRVLKKSCYYRITHPGDQRVTLA